MKPLPIIRFGDDVQGVRLCGDKYTRPEPISFRVAFPGGDVEVSRTSVDDYWIHVRVNRPASGQHIPGETPTARIVDARVDAHDKHGGTLSAEVLAEPELYHLAVRVERDQPAGGAS